MITFNNKRAVSAPPNQTGERLLALLAVAILLLIASPGCQWMYTDTGEPPATKDKFLWNDTKPKSSRNSFNVSGLSDESQAIEKNLGGR